MQGFILAQMHEDTLDNLFLPLAEKATTSICPPQAGQVRDANVEEGEAVVAMDIIDRYVRWDLAETPGVEARDGWCGAGLGKDLGAGDLHRGLHRCIARGRACED